MTEKTSLYSKTCNFLLSFAGIDASGQLIGRYCGDKAPSPISAPYRNLYVQFRSDSSEQRTGFKMYYSASGKTQMLFF